MSRAHSWEGTMMHSRNEGRRARGWMPSCTLLGLARRGSATRSIPRSVLLSMLFALSATASAAPVSYIELGTIVDSTYAGVNPGDPITIVVTYDATTGPPFFQIINDGTEVNVIQDQNGDASLLPWVI